MTKYKRFSILVMLTILVMMALAIAVPQSFWGGLCQKLSAAAKLMMVSSGTDDVETQEHVKVIIAVDTSKTMAEGFPGVDAASNVLQSTVVLAELLAAQPHTSVMFMPFCSDMNQRTNMCDGDEAGQNVTLKNNGFMSLENEMADLRQTLREYEMPTGRHTAINWGLEQISDFIENEENTRYAVILITDGKTAENKFTKAIRELKIILGNEVDFYLVYPDAQADKTAIKKLGGIITDTNQGLMIGVKNKGGLLKAYLDISADIADSDYQVNSEVQELPADPQDNTFSFTISDYHCGLAVAAPEGYYIKAVTVEGALGMPISLYTAPEDDAGSCDANGMLTIDSSTIIERDNQREYAYTIVICPYEIVSDIAQTDAKPTVYVLCPAQDRFCVSVWTGTDEYEEAGGEFIRYYAVRYGVDVAVQFNYIKSSEDECTMGDYEIMIDDEVFPLEKNDFLDVDEVNKTVILTLFAEDNDADISRTISIIKREDEAITVKEALVIELINQAPEINNAASTYIVTLDSVDPGCINLEFESESSVKVMLSGIAADPEGEEVEFFFSNESDMVSSQYNYEIVIIDDIYWLQVEKIDTSEEELYEETISISFRDETGKTNCHDFYVRTVG